MKLTYYIEIDWKPGIRSLWIGIADYVSTIHKSAFKRADRSLAERAALRLRYKNAVVLSQDEVNVKYPN